MRRRLRSLATGITAVSVVVAICAISIIAVGVLVVAQSTFNRLMVEAGTPAADAQAMFDHSVATIFAVAAALAVVISVALAMGLAALLSRPLRHMAVAAERIAWAGRARFARRLVQPDGAEPCRARARAA